MYSTVDWLGLPIRLFKVGGILTPMKGHSSSLKMPQWQWLVSPFCYQDPGLHLLVHRLLFNDTLRGRVHQPESPVMVRDGCLDFMSGFNANPPWKDYGSSALFTGVLVHLGWGVDCYCLPFQWSPSTWVAASERLWLSLTTSMAGSLDLQLVDVWYNTELQQWLVPQWDLSKLTGCSNLKNTHTKKGLDPLDNCLSNDDCEGAWVNSMQ